MFSGIADEARTRLDITMKAVIAGAIAAFAGVAAFACLLGAFFIWVLQTYSALYAWAAVGGVFAFITLIALISLSTTGRRRRAMARATERRVTEAERQKIKDEGNQAWWQDPTLLITGVQIVRTLGIRRMLPILAVGAIVAGFAMSRQDTSVQNETPEMQPAE